MGHPNDLLSDRELHNFAVFLKANPHLTHPPSQGAFDAMPSKIRRVPGKQIKAPSKDFRKGGRFDTARYALDEADPDDRALPDGGTDGTDLLRRLLTALNREDWIAIWDQAHPGAEDDLPENGIDPDEERKSRPPAMDSAAARSFAQRFPDAALVRVNTMGQQPAPKSSHMTAKGAASFYEMYPDAARIKV
ncbi:hypothetical protein FP026_29640 [Rhizobium tropici]|uniref:Uncharacterized protein n=1 Tax=Rhizobium tropici TaxID=398 RepID=A0A5B0VKV1_RHITR|nr:hypothetical protein [Rhizobium tropici]KAA1174651.1 hypothetical protein FP026_29640 [Rhizobium tropici]